MELGVGVRKATLARPGSVYAKLPSTPPLPPLAIIPRPEKNRATQVLRGVCSIFRLPGNDHWDGRRSTLQHRIEGALL